jgi:hypothetical protein
MRWPGHVGEEHSSYHTLGASRYGLVGTSFILSNTHSDESSYVLFFLPTLVS